MAKISIKCKYFPSLPARWHCTQCQVDMANECAKEAAHSADKKVCPICFSQLQSLGISNSIRPFWERIPKFFAYPAQLNTLLYLAALSLLTLVAIFIPLVGVFALLAASFTVIKYSYKCLNHAAQGNISPPDTSLFQYVEEYPYIVWKQFCIFVFTVFAITFGLMTGKVLGLLIMFFSLLSLPAMIMILAMTGRFFAAINPVQVINVITSMGKSYLILYVFLLLVYGGGQLVQYWGTNLITPIILFPTLFFINAYFSIVIFSMMGYAIYQFHEKFGLDRVVEVNLEAEGIDIRASGINKDPFLNEIHILLTEGLIDEAIKRLAAQLKGVNQPPLTYHDKYHYLLKLTNDKEKITEHTSEYIRVLLKQPKVNKGTLVDIYGDCLKLNPLYFYPDARVTVDLARTAQELFKYNNAMLLLNRFGQNYPDSEQIPYAYFIAAQLLVDHKQDETQAKKILQGLLKKYPKHELTESMQKYLNVLENLKT